MQLKTIKNKNVLTFYFDGELDENSATRVREKMDEDISYASFDKLVLDFKYLTFMDSTGIGVIIGRYKKLISKHIPMYVTNVSQHIDKILQTTGMYGIITKIS